MPICLLGLLLLLLLLVLETLSILVIGSWIPHARSTGARRALHWSATRAPLERDARSAGARILKLYCYRSAGVRILELYTLYVYWVY